MGSYPLTGWRRMASAMWPAPRDPQIYAQLEIDAEALCAFIEAVRARGRRVTPTSLVARALTVALAAVPELNVRIIGARAFPRPRTEIFFITATRTGGDDLSGVKLDTTDSDVFTIAAQLEARAGALRAGSDAGFGRAKGMLERLPQPVLRAALRVSALVTERLQWSVPSLGMSPSPFGSAMISSVGALGLPSGFAPLSWMYDVPLLLLVGEIDTRACVVDGQVVARRVLPVSATIDHRYVDGAHLARALAALRGYLADPARHEPQGVTSSPPT